MLHVEVNLVQVDAEVTDAKGKPVTNLTAADFELRQDGKPQTITNFSYIDTSAGAGVAPRAPRVKGAPALPPVDLRPADVRRTFVVVVDDLGVAWENLPAIKHALRKFVEQEKQPTDLVAIISTGGGMGIFQQFTTDPKQLLSAVDHLKFNPIFNRVGISSFPSINPLRMPSNPIRGFVSRQQSAMSIGSILRVLRNMPGRKILLLFSEEMSMISGDTFVQQLGDQAIRASVAIYTVDPRGLPTLQLTAADNTRGMTSQQISRIPVERSESHFYSQSGLSYLAQQTGGLFFRDDNDIDGAVAQVAVESSGYYLIGYQPDASTFSGANRLPVFHKLTVRVNRKGLHVRSRAGFYNRPDQPRNPSRIGLASKTREGQIESAFDSPFSSNSIHLRLVGLYMLLPTDGVVKATASEITNGAKTDLDKARAIYNWIVDNTFRNPKIRGCGVGDIRFMLESKDLGGKCADLNALYVGLARAAGLPSRDVYGIRIAKSELGYKSLGASSENRASPLRSRRSR